MFFGPLDNILVYMKRQKVLHADRKHETTSGPVHAKHPIRYIHPLSLLQQYTINEGVYQ